MIKVGQEVEILTLHPNCDTQEQEFFPYIQGHTFFVDCAMGDTLGIIVSGKYHKEFIYNTKAQNVRVVEKS